MRRLAGGSLAALLMLSGCQTAPAKALAPASPIASEDRILIERNCGLITHCAGWSVEARPDGQLRIEGIAGVAQRGIVEITREPSPWPAAVTLLEAFGWADFEGVAIRSSATDCLPLPSHVSSLVLVRWEQRGAPVREASIAGLCFDAPLHQRVRELEAQLELLFLGPPSCLAPS
jgi:hypothetical protein